MTSYGNDSRYYAVSDSPGALAGERRLSKGARQLEALFEARDPDLERRVVRALPTVEHHSKRGNFEQKPGLG